MQLFPIIIFWHLWQRFSVTTSSEFRSWLQCNPKNWQGRDINISLSSEGAVFQVRLKPWVFGTPHTSMKSNFLLQVSLGSKKALLLQYLDSNSIYKREGKRHSAMMFRSFLLLANVLSSYLLPVNSHHWVKTSDLWWFVENYVTSSFMYLHVWTLWVLWKHNSWICWQTGIIFYSKWLNGREGRFQ